MNVEGVNFEDVEIFNKDADLSDPRDQKWEWMIHFWGSEGERVIHRPCDLVVLITYHHQVTSHVKLGTFSMTLGVLDLSTYHQSFIRIYDDSVAELFRNVSP